MELDLGMDAVEGDWENGPTVDDIISSVMKTESKFGKKKIIPSKHLSSIP